MAGETSGPWEQRDVAAAARPGEVGKDDSWWRRSIHRRKDGARWVRVPLILVVLFMAAVLVRSFAFETFYMPTASMGGVLQTGDRVLVNKVVYDFRQPGRGEVVVFHGPSTWQSERDTSESTGAFATAVRDFGSVIGLVKPGAHDYVRRVIGLPGDTVACCDSSGRVIVNGVGIDEPYVTLNAPVDSPKGTPACNTRRFSPIVVQPGDMFVLGDDRLLSQDSRCQGQVPLDDVIGQAVAITWPAGHWTWLSAPTSFADVPKPYSMGDPSRIPVDLTFAVPLVGAFGIAARSGRRLPLRRRRLRS